MHKLLLTIVAVKKIHFDPADHSELKFSEDNLNYAAQKSLEIGGFVTPPVLLRKGDEINPSYQILSGHFQCYAALRAYKLDPLRGESVPAIVIRYDDPNWEILLHQLNCISNATTYSLG
jgi:hypothetical protein